MDCETDSEYRKKMAGGRSKSRCIAMAPTLMTRYWRQWQWWSRTKWQHRADLLVQSADGWVVREAAPPTLMPRCLRYRTPSPSLLPFRGKIVPHPLFVMVEEAPTSFSPFSLVDCILLSHFSFNDFITVAFPDLARDQGGVEVLCRRVMSNSRKNRATRVKQTPISLKNSSVFDWFIYEKPRSGVCHPQLIISQPFPMITNV